MLEYEKCTKQEFFDNYKLLSKYNTRIGNFDNLYTIKFENNAIGLFEIEPYMQDGFLINWFEIFTRFQKNKFGFKTVELIVEDLKDLEDLKVRYIYICPKEEAEPFWRSCGFAESTFQSTLMVRQL